MKTVVITGTTRGIGRALVNKFLEEGFKVIGTSTSGESDLTNSNFEIVKLDLADPKSIDDATKAILSKSTQIDVLINNSGINLEDWDVENIDILTLRKTLEVNLVGPIDFTEKLLHKIVKNGQIINLSSRLGSLTQDTGSSADNPSYRISKAAINMYTKILGSRLESEEITVSSVHPGWVKTYLGGDEAPRDPEEAAEQIFKLATTAHPTGKFWYDNKEFPW